MNNIGYMGNYCSLPRVNFLPKLLHHTEQNQPFHIKSKDTSYRHTGFDIGLNGKAIVVAEEFYVRNNEPEMYTFTFFMYYNGDLSKMYTRTLSYNQSHSSIAISCLLYTSPSPRDS